MSFMMGYLVNCLEEAYLKSKECMNKDLRDEEGMGVIEVTLIVVVLVGLAILFKSEIMAVASTIFTHLKGQVNTFK